jgi:hypothetical protein
MSSKHREARLEGVYAGRGGIVAELLPLGLLGNPADQQLQQFRRGCGVVENGLGPAVSQPCRSGIVENSCQSASCSGRLNPAESSNAIRNCCPGRVESGRLESVPAGKPSVQEQAGEPLTGT